MYILAASVKRKRGGSRVKIPQEFPKVLFPTWFISKVAKFHTSMYHHSDYFVIVMKRQFFKTWCFNLINKLPVYSCFINC